MLRLSWMWVVAMGIVVLLTLAAGPSAAQSVVVAPPAYVSYYSPSAVYCPPTVAYYAPPAVSYYGPPATVSYYAPPAVSYSYYPAPAVSYYAAPAATTTYRYGYGILPRNRFSVSSYYGYPSYYAPSYGYAPAVVPARASYYSPAYYYP